MSAGEVTPELVEQVRRADHDRHVAMAAEMARVLREREQRDAAQAFWDRAACAALGAWRSTGEVSPTTAAGWAARDADALLVERQKRLDTAGATRLESTKEVV